MEQNKKFVIARTKQGALGVVRKVREGEIKGENFLFDSFREAYRIRRHRYRPAEWKDHKIFVVTYTDNKEAVAEDVK